jgi:hypothetical protein
MPGTQDANAITVGANGRVMVAPYASVALWPTNVATALDSAFVDMGLVSDDGVTFTNAQEITDINAWQSFFPVRKIVASKSTRVEFILKQWDHNTVPLALGGGTVTAVSGVHTYLPPDPSVLDLRATVVEWTDGSEIFRLVIPRGMATGEVSSVIARTGSADLPIGIDAIPLGAAVPGSIQTQPFYFVTNAGNFVT